LQSTKLHSTSVGIEENPTMCERLDRFLIMTARIDKEFIAFFTDSGEQYVLHLVINNRPVIH
jgi:hypothetical protein